MASTTIQNAPSSSSSPSSKPQPEYEVLVSFSGEDTGSTFTDHLYHALDEKRIITFKGNKDLKMEDPISAEILECNRKIEEGRRSGLKVLPIFYHVEPDDVWYQSGTFEVAFAEHEKRFEENTVQKWRAALTEVANLSGKHIKDG
uniref:ADP-ribosyl cyclase/cyclic ADP-ribose hydrolase n=1 Tax=Fagus sylvatica TaxID=28930 RepID=A0A2N9GDP8_FAGSY